MGYAWDMHIIVVYIYIQFYVYIYDYIYDYIYVYIYKSSPMIIWFPQNVHIFTPQKWRGVFSEEPRGAERALFQDALCGAALGLGGGTGEMKVWVNHFGYRYVCPLVNIPETMENHHFQRVNPLFLWPFSIAMFVYQRVPIYISMILLLSLSLSVYIYITGVSWKYNGITIGFNGFDGIIMGCWGDLMGLYWNLTNTNCGIRGSHGDLMG